MENYFVIVLIVLLALWLIIGYNRFVQLRNRVQSNWAQIDVALKKRFDLVANLAKSVQGYTTHEQLALEQATQLRVTYQASPSHRDKIATGGEVTALMNRMIIVAEEVPELKASANYQQLHEQLVEVEDNIRFARQFYNDTVTLYNTAIMQFPGNLIAKVFGFRKEPFFQMEDMER